MEKNRKPGQNGKGSDPRPVDEQRYRDNYDKIDWSKKPKMAHGTSDAPRATTPKEK